MKRTTIFSVGHVGEDGQWKHGHAFGSHLFQGERSAVRTALKWTKLYTMQPAFMVQETVCHPHPEAGTVVRQFTPVAE